MKETQKSRSLAEIDLAAADGREEICRRYQAVVVALYESASEAHTVAENLIAACVPAGDISVLISEGQLKESLESGACIVPPSEYQGVQRHGAIGGAFWGGGAGLLLGAEVVLLGIGAVFALPALAGATLIGIATGATVGATFSTMDLRLEGTAYRMHLHQGGALVAVYTRDAHAAVSAETRLRATNAVEVGRHSLLPPSLI